MKKLVLGLFELGISSILSDRICTENLNWIEKIKIQIFRKRLNGWIRGYVNANDGSALTTDSFERFLQYHKPVEQVFDTILDRENSCKKDEFLDLLLVKYQDLDESQNILPVQDQIVIKELFSGIYDRVDSFFRSKLSVPQEYLLSKVDQAKDELKECVGSNTEDIKEEIRKLMRHIAVDQELNGAEINSIYKQITAFLMAGKSEVVQDLLPLLEKKETDLDISTKYLLSLLTDNSISTVSIEDVQRNIVDDDICNDITRRTIFVALISDNKEILNRVCARSEELAKITQLLITGDRSTFFERSMYSRDGYKTYELKMLNTYPNEEWLIRRICLIEALNLGITNISDVVEQLKDSEFGVFEEVMLFDRLIIEILSREAENVTALLRLKSNIIEKRQYITHLPTFLQVKYYVALLRVTLLTSVNEAEEIERKVPSRLWANEELQSISMQIKIMKNEADVEDVIGLSVRTGRYFLVQNYLVSNQSNPDDLKTVLDEHKFLLGKDVSILIWYVQMLHEKENPENALRMLESYESIYASSLDYWLERIMLSDIDKAKEMLEEVCKRDDLISYSPDTTLMLMQLLLKFECYTELLAQIKEVESRGRSDEEIRRWKALALLRTGREIESFEIFISLFSEECIDDELLYYILAIANKNNRAVPENVLNTASRSSSSSVLLQVSNYFEGIGETDKSRKILICAMLRNNGSANEVYGHFFRFHLHDRGSIGKAIKTSDINTVVELKAEQTGEELTFCIHGMGVLPDEPYNWENATHISKDYAIRNGLFRKQVGDQITINSKNYVITALRPIERYFGEITIRNLVGAGVCKPIVATVDEEGNPNMDELICTLKENLEKVNQANQWVDQYNDFRHMPLTFFFLQRCVRLNYLRFVVAMINNPDFIIRELVNSRKNCDGKYILSFTSLIVLHEIGVDMQKTGIDVVIPESTQREISVEADQIISESNQDIVAAMELVGDKIYIDESSEEEKQIIMQNAVSIREYSKKINVSTNKTDLHIHENKEFNCKEFLGICDYDAVAIAQQSGRILVSTEAPVTAFSNLIGVEVKTTSVADFIAAECNCLDDMLTYVEKMLGFKMMTPFSANLILRMISLFEEVPEEYQKATVDRWSNILAKPQADEKYLAYLKDLVADIICEIGESVQDDSRIWRIFTLYAMYYHGFRAKISWNEEGQMECQLVSS